jgi:hypothetical protein
MEKREEEVVLPKKQEQTLCNTHKEPVILFSYPFAEFVC